MKGLPTYTLLLWLATTAPLRLVAQNNPAHINKQQLLQAMPGYNEAQDSMQAFINEAQTQYYELSNGYVESETQWQKSLDEADKALVDDYIKRILYFEKNIERLEIEKEKEYFEPLRMAIEKAIGEVVLEQGYTDINDSSYGVSLLPLNSVDIMPLVKQKLGINP